MIDLSINSAQSEVSRINPCKTRAMYSDMENGPETERGFYTALALLHSADVDSAERLRQMLDESIAKKFGHSETVAARIHGCDTRPVNIVELSWNQKTHGSTNIDQDMTNGLEDDERMDIPTISIPDEGSSAGDGALCKICNGARLGPLILLECQECQDVYHPLCHQPPVLDLDIYDPRLVWHCAKCVEVSYAANIVASSVIEEKKLFHPSISPGILINDTESEEEVCRDSDDHLNYFRRSKNQFQLRNTTSIGVRRSSKRQTKTMERPISSRIDESLKITHTLPSSGSTSSTIHLRKRVGSKLTMTRATAK